MCQNHADPTRNRDPGYGSLINLCFHGITIRPSLRNCAQRDPYAPRPAAQAMAQERARMAQDATEGPDPDKHPPSMLRRVSGGSWRAWRGGGGGFYKPCRNLVQTLAEPCPLSARTGPLFFPCLSGGGEVRSALQDVLWPSMLERK